MSKSEKSTAVGKFLFHYYFFNRAQYTREARAYFTHLCVPRERGNRKWASNWKPYDTSSIRYRYTLISCALKFYFKGVEIT